MSKTIGELGIDTQQIYDRLVRTQPGDKISYSELTKLIGRDVTGVARGCLTTARKRAQKHDQAVFDTIKGEGIVRLTDVGVVNTGETVLTRIRRASRRGFQKMAAVANYDALPNDAKVKHNTFASMFGAVAMMAKPSEIKKLQGAVAVAQEKLPLAKTLEAFRG